LRTLIVEHKSNLFYLRYLIEMAELVQDIQTSISQRSLSLEMYFSTSSTVNLFTGSQSIQITGYPM